MKPSIVGILCLAVVGIPGLSAVPSGKIPGGDRENIQGTWKVVSAESGGKPIADFKGTEVLISGEIIKFRRKGKPQEFPYRLDPTKSPKQLDLFEGKAVSSLGIYELDGKRLKVVFGLTLRIHRVLPGGQKQQIRPAKRPVQFDSRWGAFFLLKRNNP